MKTCIRLSLLAGAALLVSACASTPPPTAEMAVSTAALAHAAGAGANEMAPAEMNAARGKLQRARAAMAEKNYEQALTLAQEVNVDARLAEAKTMALKAAKASDTVREDSRALREEMDRKVK